MGLIEQVPWEWIAFSIAAWSVIANDSIQTLGGLISASRGGGRWALLGGWILTATVAAVTIVGGWYVNDGDPSWGRLATRGLTQPPPGDPAVLVAPLAVLVLTWMGIPVSTTFLILGSSSGGGSATVAMVGKSLTGWIVALTWGSIVWRLPVHRVQPSGSTARVGLSIVTALGWTLWLQHDVANLAVYLPRRLDGLGIALFTGGVVVSLWFLFMRGGSGVQARIDEKVGMDDPAQVLPLMLAYLFVLGPFTWVSATPMSTTWAFVGLLGGRELALRGVAAWRVVARDGVLLGLGLGVSMAIAAGISS